MVFGERYVGKGQLFVFANEYVRKQGSGLGDMVSAEYFGCPSLAMFIKWLGIYLMFHSFPCGGEHVH